VVIRIARLAVRLLPLLVLGLAVVLAPLLAIVLILGLAILLLPLLAVVLTLVVMLAPLAVVLILGLAILLLPLLAVVLTLVVMLAPLLTALLIVALTVLLGPLLGAVLVRRGRQCQRTCHRGGREDNRPGKRQKADPLDVVHGRSGHFITFLCLLIPAAATGRGWRTDGADIHI
jgi:hypothetical protein